MENSHPIRWNATLSLFIILLFAPNVVCASTGELGSSAIFSFATGKKISAKRILDELAQELSARIVVLDKLKHDQIVLNTEDRSAMEILRSILRGGSYALIYNAPPYECSFVVDGNFTGHVFLPGAKLSSDREGKNGSKKKGGACNTTTALHSGSRLPGNAMGNGTANDRGSQLSVINGQSRSLSSVGSSDEVAESDAGQESSSADPDVVIEEQELVDSTVNQIFNEDERNALLYRIEKLQQQIDSGEADRFYSKWSQIKDSKYVYYHYSELERLQARLEALED